MAYRLAILLTHPIQYHAPIFRALAQHPAIDLTVYYCSEQGVRETFDPGFGMTFKWDIPLLEGYRYTFLTNSIPPAFRKGFWGLLNLGIVWEVFTRRYDALYLYGYTHAVHWLAALAARLSGTPCLLRAVAHILNEPTSFSTVVAKKLRMRFLFSLLAGGLYGGQHNLAYYHRYGMPKQRLFFAPIIVDNTFFRQARQHLQLERQNIRHSWGIEDDRPVIVFVGKLIAIKQPLLLLTAYAQVRQHTPCALVYAGEGSMREAIEQQVRIQNIPDVYLTGFLNQREISQAYMAGDILVLPSSSETWGRVINEGMNFGLPVIVSDRVGCGPDLVKHWENGYIFPYQSQSALVAALRNLVDHPERRAAFGRRSAEIIASWGMDEFVAGFVQALHEITRRN
jgi:glycosyltransferase involved in cell wall biosynthesis